MLGCGCICYNKIKMKGMEQFGQKTSGKELSKLRPDNNI
jgi:hypothetical protein